MELQTKYHGNIEIDEGSIVQFSNGIPGFPEEAQFVVLPLEEDETIFILQSVKTEGLGFVMVNPFLYFSDYDFTLEDQFVQMLDIKSPEDILIYCILTVKDPFEKTTANLQAPVIINTRNYQGKQVILNNDKYTTRHKLFGTR
jgi:flagellar assembly factor FliW